MEKGSALIHAPFSFAMIQSHHRIPDFITFLRHHIAHIENQLITPNNWVVLGGASEKHVPL